MGAVHVSFGNFKDVRSQVMANRGFIISGRPPVRRW